MKRLVGKRQVDETVKNNSKYWTFKLQTDEHKRPMIKVEDLPHKNIYPEDISAKVLEKLKNDAEQMIKGPVSRVVITVPAYFNQAQRHGTIKAAHAAGLEVMELINEPTAAALAYGFDNKKKKSFNLLVFDLGGGTFDVVVVNVKNGHFETLAIGGDTQLGGRDFDNKLMDHFNATLKKDFGFDCFERPTAQQTLLKECIEVKHTLAEQGVEKAT